MNVPRISGRHEVRNTSRHFCFLARLHSFFEHWCFFQPEADIKTDNHHHGAEKERYTPAPRHERAFDFTIGVAQEGDQNEEEAVSSKEAQGSAKLWPHGSPSTFAFTSGFGGKQGRA